MPSKFPHSHNGFEIFTNTPTRGAYASRNKGEGKHNPGRDAETRIAMKLKDASEQDGAKIIPYENV